MLDWFGVFRQISKKHAGWLKRWIRHSINRQSDKDIRERENDVPHPERWEWKTVATDRYRDHIIKNNKKEEEKWSLFSFSSLDSILTATPPPFLAKQKSVTVRKKKSGRPWLSLESEVVSFANQSAQQLSCLGWLKASFRSLLFRLLLLEDDLHQVFVCGVGLLYIPVYRYLVYIRGKQTRANATNLVSTEFFANTSTLIIKKKLGFCLKGVEDIEQ